MVNLSLPLIAIVAPTAQLCTIENRKNEIITQRLSRSTTWDVSFLFSSIITYYMHYALNETLIIYNYNNDFCVYRHIIFNNNNDTLGYCDIHIMYVHN